MCSLKYLITIQFEFRFSFCKILKYSSRFWKIIISKISIFDIEDLNSYYIITILLLDKIIKCWIVENLDLFKILNSRIVDVDFTVVDLIV